MKKTVFTELDTASMEEQMSSGEQSHDAGFKVWKCVLCGFAYDEAIGMPVDGIPPGTRWADVPESWLCPDCSASKSDFEMVEV